MKTFTRRAALLGAGAVIGGLGVSRFSGQLPSLEGTKSTFPVGAKGTLNDASGLSETPVFKHIVMPEADQAAQIAALRDELKEARAAGRPVNIGAARHSMGGQAIPRNGHALTFDASAVGPIEGSENDKTVWVTAGTRWSQIIAELDPQGFGPKVMQSNNDFGVAATFCVNAHGWPVPHGPMGATVREIELMLADGEIVTASRDENAELFNMSMGGYGLSGAILSMRIEVARNMRLVPSFTKLAATDFAPAFVAAVQSGEVPMAYGRLNVDREAFFEEALLITYREDADQSDLPAASGSGLVSKIASRIYRAQLHNEPMKRLRWWTETDLGPAVGSGPTTRNSLINEPVVTLDDRDPTRTDILHEYFIAPEAFRDFLRVCRDVIPASYQEFLNVTLRYVGIDRESYLTYAPVPRIAAVMSFSQEMTERAEADMARMTRALIDGITAIGGTYYLPYRPHATLDQFTRAYPRAAEFAAAKRALDPQLTFRNNLWDSYLGRL